MDSDRIKGKIKQAEGKIQEGVGRMDNAARKLGRDLKDAVD